MKDLLNKAFRVVVGALPWKTIFKTAAAVFLLIGAFYIWDYCDFAYTRGSADPKEMAREEKLWLTMTELHGEASKSEEALRDIVNAAYANDKLYASTGSVKLYQARNYDTAAMQKCAVSHAERLRESKQRIWQLQDNKDAPCRWYLLMLHALFVRSADLQQMGVEILLNTEAYSKHVFTDEKYDEFYERYSKEKHPHLFKYPSLHYKEAEVNILGLAMTKQMKQVEFLHTGYGLWQGRSPDSLREELTKWIPDNESGAKLRIAEIESLYLRRRHGSAYAAVWYPLTYFRRQTLPEQKVLLMWRVMQKVDEIYPAGDDPSIDAFSWVYSCPSKVPQNIPVPSAEDKLWYLCQYLSLNTDNFLWNIKFSDKSQANASKLLKRRIRPQYDKNGPEMQFYSGDFRADMRRLSEEILPQLSESSSELQAAFRNLCMAGDGIYAVWNNYRNGKIDYKTYFAELQKAEEKFEERRQKILSLRWDYIAGRCKNNYIYTIWSLQSDGVNTDALGQIVVNKTSS